MTIELLAPDTANTQAFDALIDAFSSRRMIGFVGAGSSKRLGYPLWQELIAEMKSEVTKTRPRALEDCKLIDQETDILFRAEEYKGFLVESQFEDIISRLFRPKPNRNFDDFHIKLVELPFKHIITTNYDSILESAHVYTMKKPPITLDWTEEKKLEKLVRSFASEGTDRHYVYIHGRYDKISSIILGEKDYKKLYYQADSIVEKLLYILLSGSMLFLGFSLSDIDVMYLFRRLSARFGLTHRSHFAILPSDFERDMTYQRRRLNSMYGIEPIYYQNNPDAKHRGLEEILSGIHKILLTPSPSAVTLDVQQGSTQHPSEDGVSGKFASRLRPTMPPARQRKKMLILASNPNDTSRLRLDQEVREIINALRDARSVAYDVFILWAAQIDDVRQSLLDIEPHMIHFCGHGIAGKLMFEDSRGQTVELGLGVLSELMKVISLDSKCYFEVVTMNACSVGNSVESEETIKQFAGEVIYFDREISDGLAIGFASAFYRALAADRPVEAAYRIACTVLSEQDVKPKLKTGIHPPKGDNSSIEVNSISNNSRKKIVMAMASPKDLNRLRTDREAREVYVALKRKIRDREYILENYPCASYEDVHLILSEQKPWLFHFSGYGKSNELILMSDDGLSDPISIDTLIKLLEYYKGITECIVLNSSFSALIARKICKYVRYCIGYENDLADSSSTAYSAGFYRAIALGRAIEDAHKAGCLEIQHRQKHKDAPVHLSLPRLYKKR